MIRTNVHLTEQQREALRQIADQTGLSVAKLIRWAIDGFLEQWAIKPYTDGWPHIEIGFTSEEFGRSSGQEEDI
jgi:hypothetical protein